MKKRAENSAVISKSKRLLILIVSGIIAIALGLTCGLCFGTSSTTGTTSGVESGDVSRSATKTLTSAGTYNYTASGAIINNDVINMQYCGGVYTIVLPKGTYKFEVWGAQGGNAANNMYKGGYGGKGGYGVGGYVVTGNSATVYVIVGQQGYSYGSTIKHGAAGGFGAGGGGAHPWGSGNSSGGAGGGGLSGFFKSTSYLNNELLIAGAGGGGGGSAYSSGSQHNSGTDGGWGGGTTGGDSQYNKTQGSTVSHKSAGNAATGATQSAAGVNKGSGRKGGRLFGGAGYGTTIGNDGNPTTLAGGAALTNTPSGSSAGGGGGGGSGYWGGSGSGPYGMGGSGGSGWNGGVVTTTATNGVTVTKNLIAGNASMPAPSSGTQVGQSGNGYAKITAIQVNQAPNSKAGATFALGARGDNKSVPIAATAVAVDDDYNNYSGGSPTRVYFTDGNTGNLDTVSKNANNLRLENGASANSYLDWNISNGQITITKVLKYPRKGIDGSTQPDGTLKLKTKVRDDFGTNTTRGFGDVTFLVTVSETQPTKANGVEINKADDATNIYNNAYLGTSKNTSPELATEANIYHPGGAGKYTLLLARPLRLRNSDGTNEETVKVTLNAEDIFKNAAGKTTLTCNTAGTPYDDVYISINDTSRIKPGDNARMFAVQELDKNGAAAIKTSGSVAIQNAFKTITLIGWKADADYQVMSTKVYVVERATSMQVPSIAAFDLDIVFKIDNTRPTVRDNVDPVVTLNAGGAISSETYTLDHFYVDVDGKDINSKTHRITEIKVPKSEFVQLDKYGKVVPMIHNGTSYFNVIDSSKYGYPSLVGALKDGEIDRSGNTYVTGFQDWYISTGAVGTDTEYAYVQYSFSNDSFTLYGRRATHSMYDSTRESAMSVIKDGSTEKDLTSGNIDQNAKGKNAGDFYILIHVQDFNDTDDEGIWLPLGIRVSNSHPTEMNTEGDKIGASYMPTISGEINKSVYFAPMGITVDDYANPKALGYRLVGETLVDDLVPLASDPDNYFRTSFLGKDGDLNDLLTLSSTVASVRNSVPANTERNSNSGEYFEVETFYVYIAPSNSPMFKGRVNSSRFGGDTGFELKTITVDGASVEYVAVTGLKITLKNRTHDRYLYASASVKDINGTPWSVKIAIKAENTTPSVLASADVAKIDYKYNGRTISTEYNQSTSTITYNIPIGTSVVVTPYDILTDSDMLASGAAYPAHGFTLNGINGQYFAATNSKPARLVHNSATVGSFAVAGIGTNYNLQSYGGKADGYDYSSTAYMGATGELATALKSIGATKGGGMRAFQSVVSATNIFESGASGTTGTDRLFFARTNDSSNLDGFVFDPYGDAAHDYGVLADPVKENDSFVLLNRGTELELSGTTYDLDFFVITALTKTPAGIRPRLTFTVRDRSGAGSAGQHIGTRQITVIINIVNSTPYLNDPNHPDYVYTLATAAISDNNIEYPTLEILASSILADNENEDVAFFISGGANISVIDGNGLSEYAPNKSYLGNYIRVSLTSEKMTITALNSTQNITSGLFIVFYATDYRTNNLEDQSRLTIQVEVLNARPTANRGDDGLEFTPLFNPNSPDPSDLVGSWTVESFSEADISTTRYFVSSAQAVSYLKAGKAADLIGANNARLGSVSDSQVKVIVSDTDTLQGSVLSPVYVDGSGAIQYITAKGAQVDDYYKYVPRIGTTSAGVSSPYAVQIGFVNSEGSSSYGENGQHLEEFIGTNYGIVYFVENDNGVDAYTANDLIAEGNNVIKTDPDKFFDSEGRWIIKDWAVFVQPKKEFKAGFYLRLGVTLRDDSEFGGDTAGMQTALKGDVRNLTKDDDGNIISGLTTVNGRETINCYMFVKGTGLRTLDYYDQFNGYYTVTDGNDPSVSYVSTYDGNDASNPVKDVVIYNVDGKIVNTRGTADQKIKDITTSDMDGTFAGAYSGTEYKNFNPELLRGTEKAFQYSHTITVNGDKQVPTYIPMSYLALKETIATPEPQDRQTDDGKKISKGSVFFDPTSYIAYNVPNPANGKYDRSVPTEIAAAISIFDGTTRYTGSSGDNNLFANPYVTVSTFDFTRTGMSQLPAAYTNSPYLNNCLAVTTVGKDDVALGFADNSTNYPNYVGNGHMMYLAQQFEELQEHLFGLILTKKNTRASVSNLTITINVATCLEENRLTSVNCPKGADGLPDTDRYTASVTLKLEIGNSPIALTTSENDDESAYYLDMSFNTSDGAKDIGLARYKDKEAATAQYSEVVEFTDADSSDSAYFYADSLNMLSSWSNIDYARRTFKTTGTGAGTTFENTSSIPNAQASMRRYFDIKNPDDAVTLSKKPNGGVYGSNNSANEGYSRFFSATVSDGGSRLSILPNAKTVLNYESLISDSGTLVTSRDDIRAYYATRGLVPVFLDENSNRVVRAYYPLHILVFDSCGDGFGVASYVCLEIRVFIDDTKPALSDTLGEGTTKTVDYSLAVDSTYTFSLNDMFTDADMLTSDMFSASDLSFGHTGWLYKNDFDAIGNAVKAEISAGKPYTNNRFLYETGDYLMTPFGSTWKNPTNSDLHNADPIIRNLYDIKTKPDNKPDASDEEVRANQPDVIMYMEYSGEKVVAGVTTPSNNTVTIRVNRRTMYYDVASNSYKQQSKFKFILTFTDSHVTWVRNNDQVVPQYNNVTYELVINVNVINKAPYQFDQQTYRPTSSVKMRVDDTFVVLTTPVDYFNGKADYSEVSAQASRSYSRYTSSAGGNTVRDALLMCDAGGRRPGGAAVSTYKYEELTLANLNTPEYAIHDATNEMPKGAFLGYTAIARDDAAWTLRMDIKAEGRGRLFEITAHDILINEVVYDENGKDVSLGEMPIDYEIRALSSCTNQPITIIITDAEGAKYEHTIYVTVESTKPRALGDEGSTRNLNDGLYYPEDMLNNKGLFEMYMRASGSGASVTKGVKLNTGKTVDVYSDINVKVSGVAFDPDSTDDGNIALYVGTSETDIFTINDKKLSYDNGVYFNEKFEIRIIDETYKTFNIKCKAYDRSTNVDYIKFHVRDVGNNVYANALEITLRVTTLYSSLYNEHNAKMTEQTGNGMYNITKADTVYVKAYDIYSGVGLLQGDHRRGEQSTFQFLDYANAADSIDNEGADKYITDPDVAVNNNPDPEDPDAPIDFGVLNYDVRVYAFLDADKGYAAMPLEEISAFFDIKPNSNYFRLDQTKRAGNLLQIDEVRTKYLVGGRTANGNTYKNEINKQLLAFVNNYFDFSIGDDGVSIMFRPLTANIDNDILFYVEAEKKTGTVAVYPDESSSSLVAGSLFYVEVQDSAPVANTDKAAMSFSGSAVKSVISADGSTENIPEVEGVNMYTFTIFGDDPTTSIFTDSDRADDVTVEPFIREADYQAAFGEYYSVCRAGNNTSRAIDIKVDGKHLTVKINRRIDYDYDGDGHYDDKVTVPIKITGKDRAGNSADATIYVTVVNNDLSIDLDQLVEAGLAKKEFTKHSGYELTAGEESNEFVLRIKATVDDGEYDSRGMYHPSRRTFDVIKWLYDDDFTNAIKDTDSYRLYADDNDVNSSKYLVNEPLDVHDSNNPENVLATLAPVFEPDENHFTGFTITAKSYDRAHSGLAYMRILDRSGDESDPRVGIRITIIVQIGNSAPTVNEDMKDTVNPTVYGSDSKTPETMTFNIKDYVVDKNSTDGADMVGRTNTHIRINNVTTEAPEEIYATSGNGDLDNLITTEWSADKPLEFTVRPVRGFYGKQKITVEVADGDYADEETERVSFSIVFEVIYDFSEIGALKEIASIRGLPVVITPETLIEPIENKASGAGGSGSGSGGASSSAADDVNTFNPGKDYVVTGLSVPTTSSTYVSVLQPNDSDPTWRFVPKKVTIPDQKITLNVEFTLAADVGKAQPRMYNKTFNITVDNNPEPKLLADFKNGKTFYTGSSSRYDLDQEGVVNLSPSDMFIDNVGDIVSFISASTVSPTMVTVKVISSDTLRIKFNCSGETEIVVTIADLTGETHTHTIAISNHDRPEPDFWQGIVISFEQNKMIWFIIIGAVALAIVILIIVIIALKRRKRKREELEAMLISEMELEEQMMRLSAAPGPYSSFGYLPPTMPTYNDPGLMLGTGAPMQDPNVLNLNPGQTPPAGMNGMPPQAPGGDYGHGGGYGQGGYGQGGDYNDL
ncbi:MAG: hypothetical protein J1G38_07565 [Clostridiales bacterium]|nr:hypothetical protein [Clostridiales bacterium]